MIYRTTQNPASSVGAHYCPETSCHVSERSIEKLTDKQMNERMNKGQSIGPTSYVGGFKTKEKLAGFWQLKRCESMQALTIKVCQRGKQTVKFQSYQKIPWSTYVRVPVSVYGQVTGIFKSLKYSLRLMKYHFYFRQHDILSIIRPFTLLRHSFAVIKPFYIFYLPRPPISVNGCKSGYPIQNLRENYRAEPIKAYDSLESRVFSYECQLKRKTTRGSKLGKIQKFNGPNKGRGSLTCLPLSRKHVGLNEETLTDLPIRYPLYEESDGNTPRYESKKTHRHREKKNTLSILQLQDKSVRIF